MKRNSSNVVSARTAFSRRALLSAASSSFAALVASRWLDPALAHAAPEVAAKTKKAARAKACIVLWLNGGPSHIDTFDPKTGPTARFKSIKTRARGVEISEHLPMLAEQAHHLAIVRSMTSVEGNHDRARYLLHTGYSPNPTVHHPSFGGWVNEEVGDRGADLPNFVSISGPSLGAGFLGLQYGPFIVQNPAKPPDNVGFFRNVDDQRFHRREAALDAMETDFQNRTGDPQVGGRDAITDQAIRMMHAKRLAAFDVSQEPAAVQKAYGDAPFGKGVLMARRLVEAGVKVVEVVLDGWDTHQDNFEKTKKLMGTLDPAMTTLLKELEARHLLDSTLVVCMGEFGRTPKINPNDGRDHHPQAWSAVLAGGGIRGGQVVGSTDAAGDKVADKPISVPNLFATLVTPLGLDPGKVVKSPIGRPIGITDDGVPVKELIV